MKQVRLILSYGERFEGVVFPQLHDEDADVLSEALDTVFNFFEDDNVEITYPETGKKYHVFAYTEESSCWSDERYDFWTYQRLKHKFEHDSNMESEKSFSVQ